MRLLAALAACCLACPLPAQGPAQARAIALKAHAREARIALVIGNDTYQQLGALRNARADARAVAAGLEAAGFAVTLRTDLDEKGMKEALRAFKNRIQGGDVAVFYFSGHGVQLGGSNLLLPVDIRGDSEDQVRDEAIPLQRVLDDLQDQKAKFSLAIVDACRNNPFKGLGRSIGGRGLAPTSAATGQMVLFSAGAGQEALDNLGRNDSDPNGLFTRVFIRELRRPGVPVDQMLRTVREEVVTLARGAGHEQVPALYDQALGRFYFMAGTAAAPALEPPPAAMAMTGNLQVNVNAPEAQVFVDGVAAGTASPQAALNLKDLPAGDVRVKVEAPGYDMAEQQVKVAPGQWTQAALVLSKRAEAVAPAPEAGRPRVQVSTNLGVFTVELFPDAAPATVANFLNYARRGFYRGTTFHRVIPGFMVQGGGVTEDGGLKPTGGPIANEARQALEKGWHNLRGTLVAARASDPDSATSQFFVNVVDNLFLDYASPAKPGYCVFGQVVEGMDTLERIRKVRTGAGDKPDAPVKILEVSVQGARARW
jgi:cyclophilin family peptidyl-prolyl cis-trans isomerase